MKTLSTALAVIGLIALPTVASAEAGNRENVAAKVSTADLDLSKPEDVARLRDRVKRAIADACTPNDRVTSPSPDWQCYREMASNGEGTVLRVASQAGNAAHMAAY